MKLGFASSVRVSAAALLAGALLGMLPAAAEAPKAFRMIVGEPRSLDPNLVTDYSIYVNAQLFEPLARIDNSGKLTLLQAKSIDVGPDGRTWTITLNPDYKWSNGKPITAADWEYSWKRLLDPKLGGDVASMFYVVENAEAYNTGKITDVNQVGIKARGEYSFQLVTATVAPQFRAVIARTNF